MNAPDDLPGLTLRRSEDWAGQFVTFVATYPVLHGKWGARTSLSAELVSDAGVDVEALVWSSLDRHLRPWRHRDPMRWPAFDPFPRWSAFVRWLHRTARR